MPLFSSQKKSIQEMIEKEDFENIVSGLSKIFFLFYIFDLETEDFRRLAAADFVEKNVPCEGKIQDAVDSILNGLTASVSKNDVREFLDLSTLKERLDKEEFISCDFDSNQFGFLRMNMILVQRNEKGCPKRAVFAVQKNDSTSQNVFARNTIINSFTSLYDYSYYVDLKDYSYAAIIPNEDFDEHIKGETARECFENFSNFRIDPGFSVQVKRFINLNTISERMKNCNVISCEYRKINGHWNKCTFIAVKRNASTGNIESVIFAIKKINSEKEKELRTQHALQDAFAEATMANDVKKKFLSAMSHDIRIPMNGIMGMTEVAKLYIDNKEKVKDCLTKISDASKQLMNIVNEVIDMSRIENGEYTLIENEIDIENLVSECVEKVKHDFSDKNHLISISFQGLKHRDVLADGERLKKVFLNLIDNAVRFTPAGGSINISLKDNERSDPGYSTFEFVIEDNGIGMTEDFQRHMFEPFTREQISTEVSNDGMGLGLSIVKNLVHLMDGNIFVKSRLNEGTTITATMGLKVAKLNALKAKSKTPAENTGIEDVDLSGKRVLLVEDNRINAEIAMELFNSLNLETDYAQNGLEAVRMFENSERNYYSAIFMDIQMPLMDGYQATKEIRMLNRPDAATVPIIAMTANTFSSDVDVCRVAGMNEHVAKPIDFVKLNDVVRKFLL